MFDSQDAVPGADRAVWDAAADALRAHPRVRDAVVTVCPGDPAGVLAHVVPAEEPRAPGKSGERSVVDSWRWVFEDCYDLAAQDTCAESALITGWTDSFTGLPIPPEWMAEWADVTVSRIAALAPRRVAEIGVGTGLLMERIVGRLRPESYTATDFSSQSVAIARALADRLRDRVPQTTVTVHEASALDGLPPTGTGADLVLLNSVVQYFPSVRYLEEVLRQIVPAIRPGGHVFLGDLRDARLLEAFAALKHHRRSPSGTAAEDVAAKAALELRLDGELSLAPAPLHRMAERLAPVTAVESLPRRGDAPTEMTLFRYDAILHVGCRPADEARGWRAGHELTAAGLERRLASQERPFGFRDIPNARLAEALRLRHVYGMGPASAPAAPPAPGAGPDPEELCRVAERHGWTPSLRWAPGSTGAFDLWCSPPGTPAPHLCPAVPGRAAEDSDRQRAFPRRVELSWKEEVLSGLHLELPPGQVLRDLLVVTELPPQ